MPSKSAHIQVVVRVRPLSSAEHDIDDSNVFTFINSQTCTLGSQQFSFDRVFAPGDSQVCIFEDQFKERVDHVLDGFNSSIIAYGQTAAGKSYTMTGGSTESSHGIVPRAVDRIFANTDQPVQATFVELYNDRLQDLFSNRDAVVMQGDGSLKNALILSTRSRNHLMSAIDRANSMRATVSTKMNNQSSRSHAILQLTLGSRHDNAKLVLVDLAGSEKAAKTGATGVKLGEAGNINKSLTVLAMVIQNLSSQAPHVPYRDSKLTQLLRGSIGGNSKTVLIVNCSPSAIHERESLSSLRFGRRAKLVVNKATTTEELALLARVLEWQRQLKQELQQWELYGDRTPETWIDLSELGSLEGLDMPVLSDPYSGLLDHPDLPDPMTSELEPLETLVTETQEEIRVIDSEAAKLEALLQKQYNNAADGAAQQMESLVKDIYKSREHQRVVLKDLAEARALTSEERTARYIASINESCEYYVRLLTGRTDEQPHVAQSKRLGGDDLRAPIKLRRTESPSESRAD